MLHLQTLGTVDLRKTAGGSVGSLLAQPRTTALLVYLVLARPRGYHRRDRLCALFWPESDTDHARGALSQALTRLRRSAGSELIEIRGKEEVRVTPGAVRCDAVVFEEAVQAGKEASALDLYSGPFLTGFHLDHLPGFEDWMETERDRLRSLAACTARALARRLIDEGRLVEAEQATGRALILAPESEATAAELVQALAEAGDRAAALAVYDSWAATLARELELEPSNDLQALAEELRESASLDPYQQAPRREPAAEREAVADLEPTLPPVGSPESRPAGTTPSAASLPSRKSDGFTRSRLGRRTAVGTAAAVVLLLIGWGVSKSGLLAADFPVRASGRAATGLAPGDWLVVADFDGPSGDHALPLAFQTLLSQDLESAGYASLVGGIGAFTRHALGDALVRLRLPPDTAVDADIACRIAERDGAAGVLAGRVMPLGHDYVLEASILGGTGCDELIRASTVASFDDLAEAVTAVSRELRLRLGESRASIRSTPPLPPITTGYIDALRAVTRYISTPELWDDQVAGATQLMTALRIEPDFAFGHLLLALHFQRFGRFEEALPHFRQAYEFRSQLPRSGQLGMEAVYDRYIASDPGAAMATVETVIADYPAMADATVPFQVDVALWLGEWQRALDISLAYLRTGPTGLSAYLGYSRASAAAWGVGHVGLADSLFRAVPAPDPTMVLIQLLRHRDWKGAEAYCSQRPGWDRCGYVFLARGKLAAASAILAPVLAGKAPSGQSGNRAAALAGLAYIELLRNHPDSAWLLLSRADPTMPADGASRAAAHLSRFLTCAAAAEIHRSDQVPGCAIEREDPSRWDADPSFSVLLRSGAWSRRLLAVRSLERGDPARALAQERDAVRTNWGNAGSVDHLIEARAFDALSHPDSALAHYLEATRIERDGLFPTAAGILLPLAPVYRRIGELAEEAGDTATALEYYGAFVDLWSNADPELQPQVQAVRARREGLLAPT
ncbi:MAG: hypothetical protein LJF04_04460 [Gemmatimonadetes bacterium]|nr:hypothetical protein [Gemmatimonadota bacterium]